MEFVKAISFHDVNYVQIITVLCPKRKDEEISAAIRKYRTEMKRHVEPDKAFKLQWDSNPQHLSFEELGSSRLSIYIKIDHRIKVILHYFSFRNSQRYLLFGYAAGSNLSSFIFCKELKVELIV